jgi:hypothetical protein
MIKRSIHPKRAKIKTNYGMNSNMKSIGFLKYKLLNPFIIIPKDICSIAKITASFILKLFENVRLLSA